MGVLVGRPIEGVTINGLEYLCDSEGRAIVFSDEANARAFLIENGMTDEDIEEQGIIFETEEEEE